MNKQIHSLLFCSFFLFTLTLFSQTEKNPWQFSFGFNAIDTFPTGAVGQGDLFEEFFNVGDHWNLMPIPSQIGITNYIGSGFSFGLRLSLNSISKYGNTSANNDFFGAADAIVKYDLNALLKTERFSPFIETGGEDLNMKLSQARAKAVVDYLISKGIPRDNIYAKGYGESSPIESNSTARGRYLNRRVEFKISN